MTKHKYIVTFIWDDNEDFENEDTHVTHVSDNGLIRWRYGNPLNIFEWTLISKEDM